jgi:membrane-associated phospholipid phosphatase
MVNEARYLIKKRAVALLVALAATPLSAQTDSAAHVDKTFFTRRDLVIAGIGIGAGLLTSVFDERISHWTQTTGVQGSQSRQDLADAVTVINEQPLTIGAAATYLIGRLARSELIADVGLHTTEALVLTVAGAELIRAPLGRARPRASPDNAFVFEAGGGFTKFENRAYPSIHSAVAFATASALVGEIQVRRPSAVKVAAPVLYAAALIPGVTRMYLNQHWASDVVSGGIMGAWLGAKTVRYAHTHRKTTLDRWLLGTSVLPDGRGGLVAMVSLSHP